MEASSPLSFRAKCPEEEVLALQLILEILLKRNIRVVAQSFEDRIKTKKVIEGVLSGSSFAKIAKENEMSRERPRQLMSRYNRLLTKLKKGHELKYFIKIAESLSGTQNATD